eukprot:TRINITY_DN8309_c0_g1_i1.p1 TRINITY_DN8309_c0_g1~~TRINITY_DN8309_c0_g1_i1.p1  ORF type:complete len:993 (+),score=278.70 TRINITY_DN8309_c0_g1_i1:172-3150(+)
MSSLLRVIGRTSVQRGLAYRRLLNSGLSEHARVAAAALPRHDSPRPPGPRHIHTLPMYPSRARGMNLRDHHPLSSYGGTRAFANDDSDGNDDDGEPINIIIEDNEEDDGFASEGSGDEAFSDALVPPSGKPIVLLESLTRQRSSSSPAPPPVRVLDLPEKVITVPLFRRPIPPGIQTVLQIENAELAQALLQPNTYIGLFFVTDWESRKPGDAITKLDDIHKVGVLGRILRTIPARDNNPFQIYISTYAMPRIKVTEAAEDSPDGTMSVKFNLFELKPWSRDDQYIRASREQSIAIVKDILQQSPAHHNLWGTNPIDKMQPRDMEDPEDVLDLALCVSQADPDWLQEVTEAETMEERAKKALYALHTDLEYIATNSKLENNIKKRISSNSTRFQLTEQLKELKKELGVDDDKDGLKTKFQDRLQGKVVPEKIMTVIEEEMQKMSMLEPNSSEYGVTRNYLDWLTVLPWGVSTEDNYELNHAQEVLDEDHYGLDDVKERILEFIAVSSLRGNTQGKILCLVGPPGVGKTSIGKSIARALDRKFQRMSVGGLSDSAEIKGHRRTYVGAMPGKIIQNLKLTESDNPVMVIDEIDKLSRHHTGDPASALLEVLDPEQNDAFVDHYLDVPVDLSKCLFICTANTTDTIPRPLLDRMEVIRLSGYIHNEKMEIAKRYLIPTARDESGLKKGQVNIRDTAVSGLIKDYCREAGVRNLQRSVEKIFRKAAYKIVKGDEKTVSVTENNLEAYMGQKRFNSDRIYDVPPAGVVMGLSWTELGGAALYIETIEKDSGHGGPGIKVTGQLGDVMKESTDIAYSYTRAFLSRQDHKLFGTQFFSNASVHMHVPEGATPKDGPSAGVTMVTSLLSLASGQQILPNVAMTGELTLTGKVLPVGGIKEKVIAARRAGIQTVIVPYDNQKDVEELYDGIKEGMNFVFAQEYQDVYNAAFGPDAPYYKEVPKGKKGASKKGKGKGKGRKKKEAPTPPPVPPSAPPAPSGI